MKVARICYLLIALLVSQSVAAFYDSHQELQDISTHVPAHHQDGEHRVSAADLPDSGQSTNKFTQDCHHCCHCHGSVTWLAGAAVPAFSSGLQNFSPRAATAFVAGPPSALFRPPIA